MTPPEAGVTKGARIYGRTMGTVALLVALALLHEAITDGDGLTRTEAVVIALVWICGWLASLPSVFMPAGRWAGDLFLKARGKK